MFREDSKGFNRELGKKTIQIKKPSDTGDLTVEELRINMTRAANWKSPGPDRLPNFWSK